MYPKIKIPNCKLSENTYVENGFSWDAPSLITYCKEQKYPVFNLPLAAIPLDSLPFKVETLRDFFYQSKRVQDTDLKYPIIINDKGVIADGYHRVVKAFLEGRTYIKAIRIEEMPGPSGKDQI
jgi:disulfide oxidoreductase YuzD